MSPHAVMLLAALHLGSAPAPLPRPWFTGWYRPVDPVGDCKFERDGDRLTLTVPGGSHSPDAEGGLLNAPRLLRDAEGDFVAVVRVGGDFRSAARRGAGLLLTGGTGSVRLEWLAAPPAPGKEPWRLYFARRRLGQPGGSGTWAAGPDAEVPVYLRLSRRGARVWAEYGLDGKTWWGVGASPDVKLPRKFKVGVFAESAGRGKFRVWFDHFSLSRSRK